VTRGLAIGALAFLAIGVAFARSKSSNVPEGAKQKNGGLIFGSNQGANGFDFASDGIRIPLNCEGPVFVGSGFVEALLDSDFMREQIFELGNNSPEDLTFLWLESVSPQCASVPVGQWGKPLLDAYDFILSKVTAHLEEVSS